MKRNDKANLVDKVAAVMEKQKLLDKKEKALYAATRKEQKKLKAELATLMTQTLVNGVAVALQDENLDYSEIEEKADSSSNTPYSFTVSLERIRDEDYDEDDEDEKYDEKKKTRNKSAIQQVVNYDDIMVATRTYGLQPFSYKDCVVRFCYDSIEIESCKSREAVFNLLSEWRVPINLARFLSETEAIEAKLRNRQELLSRLQDSMLFTVANK